MDKKPLGIKNYGSIPHLSNSRMGSGDHHIHKGQEKIATLDSSDKSGKKREVIVQEKLDGSNVGIIRIDDRIFPVTRSGYIADTSPYFQHHVFHRWVMTQQDRWLSLLEDRERLCGEWLFQVHSTRYKLQHESFVAFDLMKGEERLNYDDFIERTKKVCLTTPFLLHRGNSISVENIMKKLGKYGFHGAIDEVEGAVWRVENITKNGRRVEFLCKYVRPEKVDGLYLDKELYNETI